MKNKGRKIYKTKEKSYNGKSTMGKFLSGALTILLIGGIGFLGYSLAEPIINYSKRTGDESLPVTESSANDQATLPEQTEAVINIPENNNRESYIGASLKVSDLSDLAHLQTALDNVAASVGYEYISVPLKVSGGEIYYASSVTEAQLCGAIKSTLSLADITSAIRAAGFKPVAEISLLRDNIAPKTYPDMAYVTADDGSRWIDNTVENGGKPWISPFRERSVKYMSDIAAEIAAADFDKAICSDIVFPPFRPSDLELMPDEVKDSERYLSLVSTLNSMYGSLMNGGTSTILEVTAVDLLQENGEVLQPWLLEINTLILNIDLDQIGSGVAAGETVYDFTGTASDKVSKVIGLVKDQLEDFNTVVRISGQNTDVNDLIRAKDVLAGLGYTSFIIG